MHDYTGPPLTRAKLEDLFGSLGFQPRAFSLYGAHVPDAMAMDHRPEGWVVFYTERGDESSLRTHATEADACLDLFERVTSLDDNFFELVAGPSLPAEADATFDHWLADRGLTRDKLETDEWKVQDSPWVAGASDYRRYWVRSAAAQQRSNRGS